MPRCLAQLLSLAPHAISPGFWQMVACERGDVNGGEDGIEHNGSCIQTGAWLEIANSRQRRPGDRLTDGQDSLGDHVLEERGSDLSELRVFFQISRKFRAIVDSGGVAETQPTEINKLTVLQEFEKYYVSCSRNWPNR